MNSEPLHSQSFRQSAARSLGNWFDFPFAQPGHACLCAESSYRIGLVFYLGLHLVVLSLLAGGESRWDGFLMLIRSPVFLVLDVVLIAGALIHGLNGIRVTLLGFGIGVRSQRSEFIFLMAAALILTVCAAVLIFIIS